MSRHDPGASSDAVSLASLIADLKQKPPRMDFEKSSGRILVTGMVVTAVAMAAALLAMTGSQMPPWLRGALIVAIVGGVLVTAAGIALQALGSLLTLRRYNQILSVSVDERLQKATSLAENLAATMSSAEIGRMLRHVRLEIRIAERMTFKVTTASAVVVGFAGLVATLAYDPVSRSLAETLTLAAPGGALGAVVAGALMHSFTDRLIRVEHVLVEAELMSGVRPKPRARFVHRRLQTRPG